MSDDARDAATARLDEALEATGASDPREYCRALMRELKEQDEDAYGRALRHFREELTPGIAAGDTEPLSAWRAFATLLASLVAEGRPVAVDPTGRSEPYEGPGPEGPEERLVLHLPERGNQRAILVSMPPAPSPAQRATHDLLVRGKQTLPSD